MNRECRSGYTAGGSFLCTDQYCARYIAGGRGKGELDTGTNHLGFPSACATLNQNRENLSKRISPNSARIPRGLGLSITRMSVIAGDSE